MITERTKLIDLLRQTLHHKAYLSCGDKAEFLANILIKNNYNPPHGHYGYDTPLYEKDFGDGRLCKCGHPYYRHFDTYEDMLPVGCKYCECDCFIVDSTKGKS